MLGPYYRSALKRSLPFVQLSRACQLLALVGTFGCTGEIALGEVESEGSCRLLEHQAESGEDPVPISVGTFWREAPDSAGFDYLREQAFDKNGRVTATYYEDRQELLQGLRSYPVDVFQVNGGSDVLQFVVDQTLPGVCPLDALDEVLDIRGNYFQAAWQPMTCGESIYALPLNVHRLNTVMVNPSKYQELQSLAEDAGEQVPEFDELKDVNELLAVLELAKELPLSGSTGAPIVPVSLCIGSSPGDAWPLPIVAFENILASYGGFEYEAIWQGSPKLLPNQKGEALARLLEDLKRLHAVSSLSPDFDPTCASEVSPDLPRGHTWQRAAELVRTGEALLTIGGDWLRAQIPESERSDIATYPFPGREGTFVYTPDTFAVQHQPDSDGSAARLWLEEVLANSETQVGFASAKQAIPASSKLTDEDLDTLGDEYLIDSYQEFRDCHNDDSPCRMLLAVSGLAPAAGTNDCFDQLGMLVAASLGVEYSEEAWGAFEEGCGRSAPENADEAQSALTELLLGVSDLPFAQSCRQ